MGDTTIVLPESPSLKASEYAKRKARKDFGRRSAIEPVIGHLKNDFRLARNYLKGTIGDAINLLMAATAFNCAKWMKAVAQNLFFVLIALWVFMRRDDDHMLQRHEFFFKGRLNSVVKLLPPTMKYT